MENTPIYSPSRKTLFFRVFTLTLFFLGVRTIFNVLQSSLQDFTYYRQAGANLLKGYDPYFTYPIQVYPPASLLIFAPLSSLPTNIINPIWTLISLFCLYLSIFIFSSSISTKHTKSLSAFIFLIALQLFPVKYGLAQGQINFLVLLGFALIFKYFSKHQTLTGIILSIIVILKFNPLLLLPLFIIKKKYKAVLVFLISFTLLNLFTNLLFRQNLFNSFIQVLNQLTNQYSTFYYNQSLAAMLGRVFVNQTAARFFNISLSVLVWLTIFFKTFNKNTHLDLKTYSLHLLAILITSPISWQHYQLWSIPALIYLLKQSSLSLIPILCIILINLNLTHPQLIPATHPSYSHVLFGTFILFLYFLTSSPKKRL